MIKHLPKPLGPLGFALPYRDLSEALSPPSPHRPPLLPPPVPHARPVATASQKVDSLDTIPSLGYYGLLWATMGYYGLLGY